MLFKIENNKAVPWKGERIDGVAYPKNIETLWTDAELESLGLYKLEPADPVDPGYQQVSAEIQVVNGKPKEVVTATRVIPSQAIVSERAYHHRVTKAAMYTIADILAEVRGITPEAARAEVKTLFTGHYESLAADPNAPEGMNEVDKAASGQV